MGPEQREQTILVIDDDPNNMAIVLDYLATCNYTILVAEDGESGLSRAEYARPDLILLDVMMPGIDGFETCRRLKEQEKTADIPVIFMTALAETEHKVKGFAAGAVDYVTKPFQREEVLARVGVHLRIRELANRLQESKELLEKRVEERTAELAHAVEALHEEIVERKRAEEDRVRLAQAIAQAAEAIFMSDDQWRFTYVNPAFEQICGYTRDEVIGCPTEILRSDLLGEEHYDGIRAIVGRDSVWSGRIATRKKDGTLFEAETTVSSVRDARGCVINYVFILRDVTHELKLERELRQSQKMEAIGTLSGGIAHDFNNILTAVIGYADLAQRGLPPDTAAAANIRRVGEASLRAKELVSRILTFSRQTEQERVPVHLAVVVDEVMSLLRSSLPTTVEIRLQGMDEGDDVILADPTQMHQVLMNLGSNAAHAMRETGGVLSVTLGSIAVDGQADRHSSLPAGSYVHMMVSDTGHGMEEKVRERIFDPYFTTKKVGEGTGMGLAVVQGIVKNHGGAISVYSETGQGTTFHIFLPKYSGEAVRQAETVEAPVGGTERILFVDDEDILAELGRDLLGSLGYSVEALTDSREALGAFAAAPHAFDLVISDMTMPGLTGKELAREIRAIRPEMPIILCTGFSEHMNEAKARELGISGFIMKPYSSSSLASIVRTVLAGA